MISSFIAEVILILLELVLQVLKEVLLPVVSSRKSLG